MIGKEPVTDTLDKRLRDIDREAARLRREIKQLSKKSRAPAPQEATAAPAAEQAEMAATPSPWSPPQRREDDLFSWRRRSDEETRESPRRAADRKLAHYLTSGSFASAGRSATDRKVLRNKALFMLFVALVVAFIFISRMLY